MSPDSNVTREAKRGTSTERLGDTDTAKQARIASPETAVQGHIHWNRM